MKTDTMLNRRKMLGLIAGAGVVALGACGSDKQDAASEPGATAPEASSDGTTSTGANGGVGEIPSETGGPFPGDGTNGPNVLTEPGVVRSDIRSSVGSKSGTADGVVLDVVLTLTEADTGAVLPGHAVYLWHCDREGNYSLYSDGTTDANFCRGVQVADGSGVLKFRTVFPAAYDGRFPHMHFEIFDALSKATNGRNAVKTSQLAIPAAVCNEVYATAGYESSKSNMSRTTLSNDIVFRDGVDKQLATVTGSVADGYTAALTVGI